MRDLLREIVGRRASLFGLCIVVLMVLLAVFAPLLAPQDPTTGNLSQGLKPGFWGEQPVGLLGTDKQGRDLLSRILWGTRTSLLVACLAVSIAAVAGISVGIIAGYYGGWIDTLLMRGADIVLAFPAVLLAIVILAVFEEPGLDKAMIAIGIVYTPQLARIVRGSTLKASALDFVEAQRALGASDARIIGVHILPNILAPVIVFLTMTFAGAILDTAALGFLGLGAQAPTAELGAMLADSREYFVSGAWWAATFPGLAILFSVLGLNLLGDGLRDALDPRLRP